ncbi:MAG: AMP-binding protein, partial [Armatimonadetes bacterium]|nr:AMP-binding protein [Armatimonadota bacterium]
MESLPALIAAAARSYADRPALLRQEADGSLAATTHAEFQQAIRRAACGWLAAGLEAGEAVVLVSENRPDWLLADLAIQSAGAICVPLYPSLPAEQVEPMVAQVKARFAVVENAAQYAKLVARRAALPALERVYLLDSEHTPDPSLPTASWADLVAEGQRREAELDTEVERRVAALTPDHLATIIFTSGTTGEPKGAMLSHGNLTSNVLGCQMVLRLQPDEVALVVLPQSHVFQRTITYLTLHAGASLRFNENMRHLLNDLTQLRPTLLCVVPRLLEL